MVEYFSFEESATSGLSAANVTTWVGSLDDTTANAGSGSCNSSGRPTARYDQMIEYL